MMKHNLPGIDLEFGTSKIQPALSISLFDLANFVIMLGSSLVLSMIFTAIVLRR